MMLISILKKAINRYFPTYSRKTHKMTAEPVTVNIVLLFSKGRFTEIRKEFGTAPIPTYGNVNDYFVTLFYDNHLSHEYVVKKYLQQCEASQRFGLGWFIKINEMYKDIPVDQGISKIFEIMLLSDIVKNKKGYRIQCCNDNGIQFPIDHKKDLTVNLNALNSLIQ